MLFQSNSRFTLLEIMFGTLFSKSSGHRVSKCCIVVTRERSLSVVNLFLDEMAKEAKNIITTVCDEQGNLSDRLLPKHCAALIAQVRGIGFMEFLFHIFLSICKSS